MDIIGKTADANRSPSRKRLLLYVKIPATHLQKPPQRFGPLMSEEDFPCAVKGVIPLNMISSNVWALNTTGWTVEKVWSHLKTLYLAE